MKVAFITSSDPSDITKSLRDQRQRAALKHPDQAESRGLVNEQGQPLVTEDDPDAYGDVGDVLEPLYLVEAYGIVEETGQVFKTTITSREREFNLPLATVVEASVASRQGQRPVTFHFEELDTTDAGFFEYVDDMSDEDVADALDALASAIDHIDGCPDVIEGVVATVRFTARGDPIYKLEDGTELIDDGDVIVSEGDGICAVAHPFRDDVAIPQDIYVRD